MENYFQFLRSMNEFEWWWKSFLHGHIFQRILRHWICRVPVHLRQFILPCPSNRRIFFPSFIKSKRAHKLTHTHTHYKHTAKVEGKSETERLGNKFLIALNFSCFLWVQSTREVVQIKVYAFITWSRACVSEISD